MKKRILIAALAGLLSAVFLINMSKFSGKTGPNIIIICIDALRPDHLGCYGYSRDTSPNIDGLAKESVLFDSHFTQAAATLPSLTSFFTSLYPLTSGVTLPIRQELIFSKKITSFVQVLKKHGYRTVAFGGGGFFSRAYGFAKGFDEFYSGYRVKDVNKILQWISKNKSNKFFLFYHFFDVHHPYIFRSEYKSMYSDLDFLEEEFTWRQNLGDDIRPEKFIELSLEDRVRLMFCATMSKDMFLHWMWKKKQRYKSAGRVIDELKRLYELGCRNIIISDDNFGANYERDLTIFKEIIQLKMELNIWMFFRADNILNHPDLVEYAAKAGAKEIFVGFEDLNVKKVDANGKNLDNVQKFDDYKRVYAILKKHNILVVGCFVQDLLDINDTPVAESSHCFEICDMAQHAQVIPLKNSCSYEKLWNTRLKGVNPFYAGILAGYELNNRGRLAAYVKNLKGLLNMNLTKILFRNRKTDVWGRRRVLNLYSAMIKNIFKVSFKKILVCLWCFNPFVPAAKKQKMILHQYLNDKFITRLVGLKGKA